MQPSTVRVSAFPLDFDGNPGPQRAGIIRDDLTFELRTWPGRGTIRVLPPDAWIVSRVRLSGADVKKTGIDFRAGQDVSGLEVELVKVPRR